MNRIQTITLTVLLLVVSANALAYNMRACPSNYVPDIDVPSVCLEKGLRDNTVLPVGDTMCQNRLYARIPGHTWCVLKKRVSININRAGNKFLISAVKYPDCRPFEQAWHRFEVCVGQNLVLDDVGLGPGLPGLCRSKSKPIDSLRYCPKGYSLPGDKDMNLCMSNSILYQTTKKPGINPSRAIRCKEGYARTGGDKNAWCTAQHTMIYSQSDHSGGNTPEKIEKNLKIVDGIKCSNLKSSRVILLNLPRPAANSHQSGQNTSANQFVATPVIMCLHSNDDDDMDEDEDRDDPPQPGVGEPNCIAPSRIETLTSP